MRIKSLRVRLIICILSPIMVALVAIGGIAFYSAYEEAQEIYDAELSHIANSMISLFISEEHEQAGHLQEKNEVEVSPDIIVLGNEFESNSDKYERKIAFRIWKRGQLLFYSQDAESFGKESDKEGLSDKAINGIGWRLYAKRDLEHGLTVEVALLADVRTALIKKVMLAIFSPMILLLPLVLILTWIGLKSGLKPLMIVSNEVKNKSSIDLTPLAVGESVVEIKPLVKSINGLLSNLEHALEKERRFTDFAAHELRTPIAVLKTQAQTALKATDKIQLKSILEDQVSAANRAASLVDQLLTLVRLEHSDIPFEILSLNELVKGAIHDKMPAAAQNSISLNFHPHESVFINGNKELMILSLANIIDNSIKYTSQSGQIDVDIVSNSGVTDLVVSDNGPGIPEDKIDFVTEQFYRASSNKQPGSGLGLAIVKRAIELMGGVLIIRNNIKQGLQVTIRFPAR